MIPEIDQQVFDEFREAILQEAPYDNCFLDENEEQQDDNNNAW